MNKKNNFGGFSKLNFSKRLEKLYQLGYLDKEDTDFFSHHVSPQINLAENFIENVIGYYYLPLGIAVNFYIDDKEYVIPMAVEETSVIAAASKTAKWIKDQGRIITATLGHEAVGQIQFSHIKDFSIFKECIETHKLQLIHDMNQSIAKSLVERGGGVKDISTRSLPLHDGSLIAVVHILINTCDAMGSNIINQICEYIREPLENLTKEKVSICILSNLTDRRLTQAILTIDNIDPALGTAIESASQFAESDPYRAATHNKGVLNGMDPIAIATGNDWRAVEAGVHAYAARTGKYSAITRWRYKKGQLRGELIAPINVGTVGGVTRLHPTAHRCLKILKIKKAEELARVMAAVGLVQNLGALRALTTEGICYGHLKLHLANLCLMAGAKFEEIEKIRPFLEKKLAKKEIISTNYIQELLGKLNNIKG